LDFGDWILGFILWCIAYRHNHNYNAVFWINAFNTTALQSSLGKKLRIPSQSDSILRCAAHILFRLLFDKQRQCVLVVGGLNKENDFLSRFCESLEGYNSKGRHIIITIRRLPKAGDSDSRSGA
jgi:hypothetical protein